MRDENRITRTLYRLLRRSMSGLFVLVMLLLALLACGTLVTQTAYYACPTSVPPTARPVMTLPPGFPTALPTRTLLPATPYRIVPPRDFYRGDAVFVGQPGAALRLRFRLVNVTAQAAPPTPGGSARNLYSWSVEIRNLGTTDYETIPLAQMVISTISTASGDLEGRWRTTDAALRAAGITNENYAPLLPNTTRVYRLAAYAPAGSARRLTFTLDAEGSNTITWLNQPNPDCFGDVAD